MEREPGMRPEPRTEPTTAETIRDWLGALPAQVREHPLPAVVLTLGLGYVVGKLLRR